jgi:hypothetical protein
MNGRLQQALDSLENETAIILTKVSAMSVEKYNHTANGHWSVNQILNHLMSSERLSLQYMKKKSLGVNDLDDSGWLEEMKIIMLKVSQRLPLRYKVPRVVLEHTSSIAEFEQLRSEWRKIRSGLTLFAQNIEDRNVRKKIYKHPVAGRLDVIQAVIFFREHMHHHLPQIQRLL